MYPQKLGMVLYALDDSSFTRVSLQNSILACVPEISIKWIPPKERSQFASYSYAGMCFGICIAYCLSGITANLFGWEAVFYVTGKNKNKCDLEKFFFIPLYSS